MGCGEIETDLTGKAALVQRGGCTFLDKVASLSQAGAHSVIIANTQPGLLRVDCLKRWDAHGLSSNAVMVSQHAWDELKAAVSKKYKAFPAAMHTSRTRSRSSALTRR